MIHEMKQGDTEPALRFKLVKEDGTSPDVTGLDVVFRMAPTAGKPVVYGAAAVIIDGPNGIVEYQWHPDDTDTPGIFKGEFFVDGKRTYPTGDDYISVVIGPRLT